MGNRLPFLIEKLSNFLFGYGSLLRPKAVAEKAQIAVAVRKEVWPIIEQGKLSLIIDSIPLTEARQAHEGLERDHIGKIILTM